MQVSIIPSLKVKKSNKSNSRFSSKKSIDAQKRRVSFLKGVPEAQEFFIEQATNKSSLRENSQSKKGSSQVSPKEFSDSYSKKRRGEASKFARRFIVPGFRLSLSLLSKIQKPLLPYFDDQEMRDLLPVRKKNASKAGPFKAGPFKAGPFKAGDGAVDLDVVPDELDSTEFKQQEFQFDSEISFPQITSSSSQPPVSSLDPSGVSSLELTQDGAVVSHESSLGLDSKSLEQAREKLVKGWIKAKELITTKAFWDHTLTGSLMAGLILTVVLF